MDGGIGAMRRAVRFRCSRFWGMRASDTGKPSHSSVVVCRHAPRDPLLRHGYWAALPIPAAYVGVRDVLIRVDALVNRVIGRPDAQWGERSKTIHSSHCTLRLVNLVRCAGRPHHLRIVVASHAEFRLQLFGESGEIDCHAGGRRKFSSRRTHSTWALSGLVTLAGSTRPGTTSF